MGIDTGGVPSILEYVDGVFVVAEQRDPNVTLLSASGSSCWKDIRYGHEVSIRPNCRNSYVCETSI
jgi:hypothetical protein